MKRSKKGFTLVELLIVVAIIAVLASMMTLASSDATVAAKAASIANGYKIIGTAFTVYHSISGDESSADYFSGKTGKYAGVSKDYVGPQVKNLTKYSVTETTDGGVSKFYVAYDFTNETAVLNKFLTYSKDMGMTGEAASKPKMRIY